MLPGHGGHCYDAISFTSDNDDCDDDDDDGDGSHVVHLMLFVC